MSAETSSRTNPRRRWSPRALSVCLLAFVVLVAALAVGTDVVRVWAQHEKSWLVHPEQLDWITTASWGTLGVRLTSASLIVVGLALVAAAVLPGNRNFLPLRSPGRNTPAFLEKSHAVRALRAAARRDHVLAATVRFGRRRVKVKVRVVAADSEAEREILERVEAAVRERFDSFGLVRPTKLVLRAKSFRPPAPKPRPGAVPLHSIEPGHAPGDDTATGPDTTPDIDTAGSDAKSETSPAALAGSSPEVGSSDGRKTRVIE